MYGSRDESSAGARIRGPNASKFQMHKYVVDIQMEKNLFIWPLTNSQNSIKTKINKIKQIVKSLIFEENQDFNFIFHPMKQQLCNE